MDELKTNLTAIFAPLASKKNIKFEITCGTRGAMGVFGDKQKLIRVLSNAINFTSDNGEVRLSITAIGNDDYRFEVLDNGKGIAKSNLEKIFEPFVQVESKQHIGNGLGLFIVQNYLKAMSSKIVVESELGVGSKFYFDLHLKPSNDDYSYKNADLNGDANYKMEPDINPKIKDEILEYARQGRIGALKQSISEVESEALKNNLARFAEIRNKRNSTL